MLKENIFKKRKGLTLTEMIIVTAIIAILVTVTVVSFSLLPSHRLESEARKIVSDLSWAREMSVAMQQNCIVVFDNVNRRYTIFRGNVNPLDMVERRNLEVDLEPVGSSIGVFSNQITFTPPFGIPQQVGALPGRRTVTLRQQARQRRIVVFEETGYIRMEP